MKKLLLLTLILCTFFSCRKDSIESSMTTETPEPPIVYVTATLLGTVINENNEPVEGAVATWDGQTYTTNEDGVFLIRDRQFAQSGSYVQVQKDGYFHNSTRFYPRPGSKNYARFKMLDLTVAERLASTSDGQVSLPGGGEIEFVANSYVTAAGEVYEGTVNVAATWLDPTAADLDERMPGDLTGRNTDNNLRALASYGMIGVELSGDQGEKLNLGNGKGAKLSFPVPSEILGNAPAEIPLWHFDETDGIWKEEGTAKLQGDTYVGEVTHFSFWNCDAPFPLIELCATLTANGAAARTDSLEGFKVFIVSESAGTRCGYTDSDGRFCGKVPKGETLRIELVDDCETVYFSETVGPFDVDTDLGSIVVDDEPGVSFLTIDGRLVDCNNDPIVNGVAFVDVEGKEFTYFLEDDNSFSVLVNICKAGQELTVRGLNLDNQNASNPIDYTVNPGDNTLNVGDLIVCDGVVEEFFYLNLDENKVFSKMTVQFTNGTNTTLGLESDVRESYMYVTAFGTTAGNYDGDTKNGNLTLSLSGGPNSSKFIYNNCDSMQTSAACFFEQFQIVEYGAVGEFIKGNFSGTTDYIETDQTGQTTTYSDRPVSGSFSVRRQQ